MKTCLLRAATGIANLGFTDAFLTNDVGVAGTPIRIDPTRGTLQAAPDLPRAAGAMAHEYGHILGLPDLFNVAWANDPTGPEQDSAGIGHWGLMGWGALGWEGSVGPTSLSAWSRMRLGWAQVIEPAGLASDLSLEPVDRAGQMARIPLSGNEFFLLEYRQRDSAYYDRGIPGEGLLIWHVRRAQVDGKVAFWWEVDLECADGRWADAGAPSGTIEAPDRGGDNLDFWAHDAAYTRAHGGNLGDSGDPFDGVVRRRFGVDTNPAATSSDGTNSISIAAITVADGRVSFAVSRSPPSLELTNVSPRSPKVAAGTSMAVIFHLRNMGGTPATNLQARLRSTDATVEIVDPELELFPLPAGASSVGSAISAIGFPRLRFAEDLVGEHTATVELAIYAGDTRIVAAAIEVTGVASHRVEALVVTEDGPLPGVAIQLKPLNSVPVDLFIQDHETSDSMGVVVFRAPAGIYSLWARPDVESPWADLQLRDLLIDSDKSYTLELPRTYLLSGVVHDAQGRPVAGHLVQVSRIPSVPYWGRSTLTDAQGAYRLKVPAAAYEVRTGSYASTGVPTQFHDQIEVTGPTVLDLELDRGLMLTIDVVDANGAGIDSVRFFAYQPAKRNSFGSSALTRDGGHAQLGSYAFSFNDIPPPYLPPESTMRAVIRADTSVTIVLDRGVTVEGYLADDTGAIIELIADFSSSGSMNFTNTLTSRGYTASLPAGKAMFAAGVPPGIYSISMRLFSNPNATDVGFPSQDLGTVEIRQDTTLALAVIPGVLLHGKVFGDIPPTNGYHSLQLSSATGTWYSAFLNASGAFSVRLVPDQYSVSVVFFGEGIMPPSQTLGTAHVTRDTTIEFNLLDDEIVQGRIVDVFGAPLPGLSLFASSIDVETAAGNSAISLADGTFAFRLPSGQHTMRARKDISRSTFVTWRLRDLEIPSLAPPVFVLPGGAALAVQVTDELGRHVPSYLRLYPGEFQLGDYLRLSPGDVPSLDIRMDSQIQREISVAPGDYFAVATPFASSDSRVRPRVIASGTSALEISTASPQRNMRLSGEITDTDGATPANVTLYAYHPDSGLLARTTTRTGKYELVLPSGLYHLAARLSSSAGKTVPYEHGPLDLFEDQILDIHFGNATVVTDMQTGPHRFALEQNYPNPFNAQTVIEFSIDRDSDTELAIFNLLGQRLRTLVNDHRSAGPGQARWDGRDNNGRTVGTGLYFYRLTARDRVVARKMLLLR